jgi:hypothetical protein
LKTTLHLAWTPEGGIIRQVWQNLRYPPRALRKHPGFTTVGPVSLAVGIGVNKNAVSSCLSFLLFLSH